MADFNVDVQNFGHYAVIRSDGYINNLGGEKIAQECDRLIEAGCKKLILNLNKSSVVNSIGVSILIEIIERIITLKGRLAFSDLTPTVAKTFKIMGLLQFAELFNDENKAVSAFNQP
jgi:anti-anti-sigma factor